MTRSDGAASALDLLGRDCSAEVGRPEMGRGLTVGFRRISLLCPVALLLGACRIVA